MSNGIPSVVGPQQPIATNTNAQPTQIQPDAVPQQPDNSPTLAAPAPPGAAQPTLTNFDQNVQAIQSVQNAWSLPQLPGEVQFDLANMQGANAPDLAKFMAGLESDVNGANAQAQYPNWQSFLIQNGVPSNQNPNSLGVQWQSTVAGLEGDAAPQIVDPASVPSIRKAAIAVGLLPKNTPLDAPWSPADDSVLYQLSQRAYQSRTAGNEPGAVPTSKLAKLDFLNPTTQVAGFTNAMLRSFYPTGKDISAVYGSDLKTTHKGILGLFDKAEHVTTELVPGAHEAMGLADVLTGNKTWNQFTRGEKARIAVGLPLLTDALAVTGVGEIFGGARAALTGAEVAPDVYGSTLVDRLTQQGAVNLEEASNPS